MTVKRKNKVEQGYYYSSLITQCQHKLLTISIHEKSNTLYVFEKPNIKT